jgi:hypothetical protein
MFKIFFTTITFFFFFQFFYYRFSLLEWDFAETVRDDWSSRVCWRWRGRVPLGPHNAVHGRGAHDYGPTEGQGEASLLRRLLTSMAPSFLFMVDFSFLRPTQNSFLHPNLLSWLDSHTHIQNMTFFSFSLKFWLVAIFTLFIMLSHAHKIR